MKSDEVPFVADGEERALEAFEETLPDHHARLTADIEKEFAFDLEKAGLVRRIYLRLQIWWKVRQQLRRLEDRLAPHDGLY